MLHLSHSLFDSSNTRALTVLALFFFFNDTATTEIYTLSLHDALPISCRDAHERCSDDREIASGAHEDRSLREDRKSTRLNSSHTVISYAVFCLKKKKKSRYRAKSKNTNYCTYSKTDVTRS